MPQQVHSNLVWAVGIFSLRSWCRLHVQLSKEESEALTDCCTEPCHIQSMCTCGTAFLGWREKKNQREHPRASNCTRLFHKMLPSSRALAVECLCALGVCLHTTVCSIRFASHSIDMGESKKKSNSSSPIMIFYYTYSVYRTGRWAVIIRRAIVSPVVVGTRTSFNPNGLLLLLAAGQVVLVLTGVCIWRIITSIVWCRQKCARHGADSGVGQLLHASWLRYWRSTCENCRT